MGRAPQTYSDRAPGDSAGRQRREEAGAPRHPSDSLLLRSCAAPRALHSRLYASTKGISSGILRE